MSIVRKVGAIVLAAAAIAVWFAMAPSTASEGAQDGKTSVSAIDLILTDDTLNQARTQGAPQQAVVNGWTARDLLEVLARQGADKSTDRSTDNRPAALLVLAVAGLALMLFTSGIPRTPATRDQTAEIGMKPALTVPPS